MPPYTHTAVALGTGSWGVGCVGGGARSKEGNRRLLGRERVRKKQEQGSVHVSRLIAPLLEASSALGLKKGDIAGFWADFACLSLSLPCFFHMLHKHLSPTFSRGDSCGVGILYPPHH